MSALEDFDALRTAAATADHRQVSRPDADGRTVGVHIDAIKAVALTRACLVLDHLSQLPKVLTDKQLADVRRDMVTMWMDGFSIGRLSAAGEDSCTEDHRRPACMPFHTDDCPYV